MFGRLAEIAAEYLRKGSKVYIEGKLRTRKWQDKTDGKDRYTTEIIADEMQMLGSKGGWRRRAGDGRRRAAGSAPAPRSPMRIRGPPMRRVRRRHPVLGEDGGVRCFDCFVSSSASEPHTGARLGA